MRLDAKAMRYLTPEDWRVLTAVEMGSKNHEVVPTSLITQIAHLRGGNAAHKSISTLAKNGLIAKVKNAKYDGYRLTYGGLDYLALHAHVKSSGMYSVGNRIGTGKESDILVVLSPSGTELALKVHRLGRISFRTVKANRDYLRNRSTGSWMYLSRLAAMKEYGFLLALYENGFTVPKPLAYNRHTVLMEFIDACPLRQLKSVPDPASLYADLIAIVMRLARFGLIHGDFNEFNLLIREEPEEATPPPSSAETSERGARSPSSPSPPPVRLIPVLIDFPQMVSIDHADAEMYFDRDVRCIKAFFERKYRFVSDDVGPSFADALAQAREARCKRLDVLSEASGFSKKMTRDLEAYMKEARAQPEDPDAPEEEEDDDHDDDDDFDDSHEGDSNLDEGIDDDEINLKGQDNAG